MKINKWILSCAMAASTTLGVVGAAPAENATAAQEQKLECFKDAHFGMFIHFGLYSSYDGFWSETPSVAKRIYTDANGNIELFPLSAECSGKLRFKRQEISGLFNIADTIGRLENWTNKEDTATYSINIKESGKYNVSFDYANPSASKGSILRFSFKGKGAPVSVDYTLNKTTGNWGNFTKSKPVALKLAEGDYSLVVSVVKKNGEAPCNLSYIYIQKIK